MKLHFDDRWCHALFGLLLAVLLVSKSAVLRYPPEPGMGPDEMLHISSHLAMMNHFALDDDALDLPLKSAIRKPHLPYLVSCLFAGVFGRGVAGLLAANMLFFFAWLALVYWVGARLFDPWTALAATGVLSAMPVTMLLTNHLGNDLQVAFFTALIVLLCRPPSRYVGWRRWAALGLLVGLGLLAKPTLPLYIGLPLLLTAIRATLIARQAEEAGALKSTWLGVLIGAGLATVEWSWPFQAFTGLVKELLGVIAAGPGRDFAWFYTINGHTAWGDMLIYYGIPATIVVSIGSVTSLIYLRRSQHAIWLGALWPAALLLVVVAEAFSRLLFPVVFIPVLYGTALLRRLKRETLRQALSVIVAVSFVILGWRVQEAGQKKTHLQFGENNPAASGEIMRQEIEKLGANEPADVLYINLCRLGQMPMFYLSLVPLTESPVLEGVHLWDAVGAFPGIILYNDLARRWKQVRYVLICDDDDLEPAAVGVLMGQAVTASIQAEENTWEKNKKDYYDFTAPSFKKIADLPVHYEMQHSNSVSLWYKEEPANP